MRKTMFKFVILAVVGGVLLFSSGCATYRARVKPVSPGAAGEPGNSAKVNSMLSAMSVGLDITGGGDADLVAQRVETKVEQSVIDCSMKMVAASASDILINVSVEADEFDKSGDYYVYDGHATGRVKLRSTGKELGVRQFSVRSKRELGKDVALRSTGDALGVDVSKWVSKTLDLTTAGYLAQDITVWQAWYNMKINISDYIRSFVKEVSAVPGVLQCRVVEQDYKKDSVTFRVVYEKDAFPEGLLNRLEGIDELGIWVKD